jgi:hypothetical protein
MFREEEHRLQDELAAETHAEGFDADAANHRLNEIYERMNEVRSNAGLRSSRWVCRDSMKL